MLLGLLAGLVGGQGWYFWGVGYQHWFIGQLMGGGSAGPRSKAYMRFNTYRQGYNGRGAPRFRWMRSPLLLLLLVVGVVVYGVDVIEKGAANGE